MASAFKEKLDKFKSTNPQAATKNLPSEQTNKPAPAPRSVKVYYDAKHGSFLSMNSADEYQVYGKSELKSLLKRKGYSQNLFHADSLTYLEAELLRIAQEDSVHFAGPLAGYQPGPIEMYGSRFLVTTGPKFIKAVQGKWETLKKLIVELLGDQARYFFGWVKHAMRSLRAGPPWAPGQLLAIAGPPRCGKSLLQDLITMMLGGRCSSPYDYMIGNTNFNADIYGAEHGLIGDTNHATDHKSRREFGAAIKKLVVERVHKLHDKGKTGFSCTPFVRLTLTLNENPEALLVLPSLDTDVKDKIILLHAGARDIHESVKPFGTWAVYEAKLRSELPAFLYAMHRWEIPANIRCVNYGVKSFHAGSLVDALTEMAQDQSILNLIDTYLFEKRLAIEWTGSATDLVRDLAQAIGNTGGAVQLPPDWRVGQLLTTLADKHPHRIKKCFGGKNKVKYVIARESD